jgi:ADP-heptose:LPS heptosyltransferase
MLYKYKKIIAIFLKTIRQYIDDYFYLKIKNKDIYIYQNKHYGIGNFINCTPTIIELSKYYDKKIDVLFDLDHVAKMYENCKYINIVNRNDVSDKYLLFDSGLKNKKIEDWKFIYKSVTRRLNIPTNFIPHTHVDKIDYKPCHEKYCVIIRGSVSDEWLELKDPGDNIYKTIIKTIGQSYKIVFVGTNMDYQRCINRMETWCNQPIVILNDMRKTLGVLNNASFVISNDTGMYHASCALNIKTFVLWKDTRFVKNKCPGPSCTYAFKDKWSLEFNNWYKKIMNENVLYKGLDND